MFQLGDLVHVTAPPRGVMQRYGRVQDTLPKWQRWINRVVKVFPPRYVYVLEIKAQEGFAEIRQRVIANIPLRKGERVYMHLTAIAEGVVAVVSRITQDTSDGQLELSWTQVRQRATELGLNTVGNLLLPQVVEDDGTALSRRLDKLINSADPFDALHRLPVLSLRIESERGTEFTSWERR
jgi:hypothetical protein